MVGTSVSTRPLVTQETLTTQDLPYPGTLQLPSPLSWPPANDSVTNPFPLPPVVPGYDTFAPFHSARL